MAENIAFSDWSEKLDTTGTNHWLPAYGLQQPAMVGSGHLQQNDSGPHDHAADYYDDDDDDDDNNGNYNALL